MYCGEGHFWIIDVFKTNLILMVSFFRVGWMMYRSLYFLLILSCKFDVGLNMTLILSRDTSKRVVTMT